MQMQYYVKYYHISHFQFDPLQQYCCRHQWPLHVITEFSSWLKNGLFSKIDPIPKALDKRKPYQIIQLTKPTCFFEMLWKAHILIEKIVFF